MELEKNMDVLQENVSRETSDSDPIVNSMTLKDDVSRETSGSDSYEVSDNSKDDEVSTKTNNETKDVYGTEELSTSSSDNSSDTDDYGNPKPKERTYTQEEVNAMFRKRFKNNPEALQNYEQSLQQPMQQQQQPVRQPGDTDEQWAQELENFIEGTFQKREQRQQQQLLAQQEQMLHQQLQEKIQSGLTRFNDFQEVVSAQPITDHMALSLRGIEDPAAFIYAASKRNPAELQRISQMRDPYAQITAMGKLEASMRVPKAKGSNAPKPVSKTNSDIAVSRNIKKPELNDPILADQMRRNSRGRARY